MTTDTSAACEIIRDCANALVRATVERPSLLELEKTLKKYGPVKLGQTTTNCRTDIVRKLREIADREESR